MKLLRLPVAMLFLVPFLWTFLTALKSDQELLSGTLTLLPRSWHWENFGRSLEAVPMLLCARNTLFLAVLCCLGHLVSCPLAAYVLAFSPARRVRLLTLAAYVVPYPVVVLPHYSLFLQLGLVNSWWPLVIPSLLGNPYFILYLRQAFRRFPRELLEAARLDGASEARILWTVVMPTMRAPLAAMSALTVTAVWNDFLGPLLYLQDQSLYTVNLGLQLYRSSHNISWNLMMAATFMCLVPVVLLFLLAQPAFLGGRLEGSER